jgi:hypothetical protein
MDEHSQVVGRVEDALGPATATMFVERGRDRHFIFELTVTGVALYVLGKYIDGFIEGLGIKDLGKEHGKSVADAIKCGRDAFMGEKQPEKKELDKHANALHLTVVALREHRTHRKGLAKGASVLVLTLEEHGIPKAEAKRTAKEIETAIWQP